MKFSLPAKELEWIWNVVEPNIDSPILFQQISTFIRLKAHLRHFVRRVRGIREEEEVRARKQLVAAGINVTRTGTSNAQGAKNEKR